MIIKLKNNFRILPIFIFLAVLTLSIRINNVFDSLKHSDNRIFVISQSDAWAEEKLLAVRLNISVHWSSLLMSRGRMLYSLEPLLLCMFTQTGSTSAPER